METIPFIKWAGGKRRLLAEIKMRMPKTYTRYFEPFLGGGALLFDLQPKNAVVGDINAQLINCFQQIKDNPSSLIKALTLHRRKHTEEYFYKIRSRKYEDKVEQAARFIYLNKTCFNGLYRENSKGDFNVPFGKYDNPQIFDKQNILNISKMLIENEVKFVNGDYKKVIESAVAGDFIYFDPPYYPVKKTSFTKYAKGNFLEKEQIELFETFEALTKKGCHVMLSNSNTEFIRELYKSYHIDTLSASRSINSKGTGRGKEPNELIITNYRRENT